VLFSGENRKWRRPDGRLLAVLEVVVFVKLALTVENLDEASFHLGPICEQVMDVGDQRLTACTDVDVFRSLRILVTESAGVIGCVYEALSATQVSGYSHFWLLSHDLARRSPQKKSE
jgi:hypothetical protein